MLRIIFMGTDCFAAPILRSLAQQGNINIAAIYTKAPKISGSGIGRQKPIVHTLADEFNIIVKTPTTLCSEESIVEFQNFRPDIAIIASYGLTLPKSILDIPRYGCINVHPSKLPRWRGAAPIQRTLMSGDRSTAVCIIKMDEGLDTGPIIAKREINIQNDVNCGVLSEICSNLGAKMLIEVLTNLENGITYKTTEQDEVCITYAKKIERAEERIDWQENANDIINKIRALSPVPGAYFTYNKTRIKVFDAVKSAHKNVGKQFGEIVYNTTSKNNKEIVIYCGDKYGIQPTLIQKEGAKVMKIGDFLRGYHFSNEKLQHED